MKDLLLKIIAWRQGTGSALDAAAAALDLLTSLVKEYASLPQTCALSAEGMTEEQATQQLCLLSTDAPGQSAWSAEGKRLLMELLKFLLPKLLTLL